MSFSRAKSAGWTSDVDVVTAAQLNTMDANAAAALDPTGGGTYTLGSALSWTLSADWTLPGASNIIRNGNGGISLTGAGGITCSGTSAGVTTLALALTGASTLPTLSTPRVYTYAQDIIGGQHSTALGWSWVEGVATYETAWRQADVAAARSLFLPITRRPHLSELHTVTVYIHGDGGGAGHAALPATLPVVTVRKRTISTGAVTTIGTTTDAPANLAAYEAYHSIAVDVSAGNHPVDGTADYYIEFSGETGANSSADALTVLAVTVSFTCDTIAPG